MRLLTTVALKVMGSSNATYYLYSNHLGSTSTMNTTGGTAVPGSMACYLPFGDWRNEPTSNPVVTDMGFTGHKINPTLNRFLSADTIVPDPANPQSFNKYSYVLNNPMRHTDPTGHCILGGDGGVSGETGIDDPYYDCSITAPPSTNPTGETIHVEGALRILSMLEGTKYAGMDLFEAALWWNTMFSMVDPFIAPLYDENAQFSDPNFHQDQLTALAEAYAPGQLEEMAREPRNNDLNQFELGRAKGVDIDYLNVLIRLGEAQYSGEILAEIGLDRWDEPSNYEPNYLNAVYAYNRTAVDRVIARQLIDALEIGHDYIEFRRITNFPRDIMSPHRVYD